MAGDELFRLVSTNFCQAVMLEEWDAPPGRFFVDYRARHGLTSVLGNGVAEEFRTISGPILLAPAGIIGGVYDAGMRLADERDAEAPLDQGWPPLTIGVDVKAPVLETGWKFSLLEALMGNATSVEFGLWDSRRRDLEVGGNRVGILQCAAAGVPAATVIVTDAALLPQQLGRLVDTDQAALTVAVATGNRLPRVDDGDLHHVEVAAEATVQAMAQAIRWALRE